VRHFTRVITLAVSSVALATLAFSSSAGAGTGPPSLAAPLTILKTVSGSVPAGTTFTATIQCDGDIIVTPGGLSDTATVSFDATGQPTTADTYGFNDAGSCTVTETAKGGATTTTYACASTRPVEGTAFGPGTQQVAQPICPAAGPQEAPITVNIEVENQTATVTIANTFAAPTPPPVTPAAQVVAQPAFTG
jgi:hypothetical protein